MDTHEFQSTRSSVGDHLKLAGRRTRGGERRDERKGRKKKKMEEQKRCKEEGVVRERKNALAQ